MERWEYGLKKSVTMINEKRDNLMYREAQSNELNEILQLYLHLHETKVPENSLHLRETWEQIIDDETRPTKHTGGRGMPPGAWILRRKSPEKQAAIKSCCLQVQKMIRLWTFTAVRATTVMKRRHLSRGCEEILFSTHCLL